LQKVTDTFVGVKLEDIKFTLVGDHSKGAPGANTKNMGSDLLSSLQRAGYTNIDTHLFNFFPGASLAEWTDNAEKLILVYTCPISASFS
jgi:hypothetical protein